MSACSAIFNCAPAYIGFSQTKAFVEKDLLNLFDTNFITTEKVNSMRTTLSEEIDDVYEECKNDGWLNCKKDKSIGIKFSSTLQAKDFASYIEEIKQPNVVPYTNGFIGFEWNYTGKLISVVFKDNGNYIYSIITDSISDYGENKQNSENQKNLSRRIYSILSEGNT